ncbi:MAG: response regulator transcription factor [Xenococcaceae cyanobacterium MO_188.B32]|nr:response regulator transcription factor [Xenococcaceae cyanobacterium MO_188.B32]
MIRLVIVDRSSTKKKSWQMSLQNKPDLKIVGFVHDGRAAIHYIEKIKPDIVLMNIDLPVIDGITITRIISQRCSNVQVILITTKDSQQELNRVLKVGARGYLLNNTEIPAIIDVIRLVHQGYFHLDSSLAQKYIFKKSKKENKEQKKNNIKLLTYLMANAFLLSYKLFALNL